jgi:hypothetical protein
MRKLLFICLAKAYWGFVFSFPSAKADGNEFGNGTHIMSYSITPKSPEGDFAAYRFVSFAINIE